METASADRRVHRRSRQGCSNCKLRRVKCDEKRPFCERCRRAHMTCTYASHNADSSLRSSHEGILNPPFPLSTPCSSNEATLSTINGVLPRHHDVDSAKLTVHDLEHLYRFQNVTVHSFGSSKASTTYSIEFTKRATSNPFLLHAAIACTAMHGRFLTGQVHSRRTSFEAYHWAIATALINREISAGIASADMSALWMAAVMTSFSTCFALETQDLDELWPIAPTLRISWLWTHKGVRTFYDMLHPGSPFGHRAKNSIERCLGLPEPPSGIDGIPQVLSDMCGLDEQSNATNNPYHTAAHTLSTLLVEPNAGSLKFLSFVNTKDPIFDALLENRDPRALALMAIWYGVIPTSAWWIWTRAQLERQAVCIYLDAHHKDKWPVQNVLAAYVYPPIEH